MWNALRSEIPTYSVGWGYWLMTVNADKPRLCAPTSFFFQKRAEYLTLGLDLSVNCFLGNGQVRLFFFVLNAGA
jgi:hypothetical protein